MSIKEINKQKKISNIFYWHNLNIGDELLVISHIENSNYDQYNLLQRYWMDENIAKKSFDTIIEWFKNTNKLIKVVDYKELKNKKISFEGENDFNWIGGSVWKENLLDSKFNKLYKFKKLGMNCNAWGGNLSVYNNASISKKKIKKSLELLDTYTFRDTFSTSFISKKNHFFHDPVYSITDIIKSKLNKTNKNEELYKITISTCYSSSLSNSSFDKDEANKKTIEILKGLKKKYKDRTLQISLLNFQDLKDSKTNKKLLNLITNEEELSEIKIKILEYNGDILKILNVINEADYCINTRFHSIVLANIFEKECFNFSYENKNYNHLKDIKYKNGKIKNLENLIVSSNKQWIK